MFKVGQKVRCVKPTDNLVEDGIYTISQIDCAGACRLKELEWEPIDEGYYLFRFKPLSDHWVDQALSKIIEEPEETELIERTN